MAAELKQVEPVGPPTPGTKLASARSMPILSRPPLSTPMKLPGRGVSRKPEPSGDTVPEVEGWFELKLPKPIAHHCAEVTCAVPGGGANQARLEH